jgi:hypothetical protein
MSNPDVEELERYNREAPCEHPEEKLYDGVWFMGYSQCCAVLCGRCKQFVDFGTVAQRREKAAAGKEAP